jgi:hypothetical protein
MCSVHLWCHSEQSSDDLLQLDMPRLRDGRCLQGQTSTKAGDRPMLSCQGVGMRKYEAFAGDKVTMKEAS